MVHPGGMDTAMTWEVAIERGFTATHAVTVNGVPETPHAHDWKVTVVVRGASLDADGLLVDFLDLERRVDAAILPLRNTDLNTSEVLLGSNPTAERVAAYIASCMHDDFPNAAALAAVRVTEAPGCTATCIP